MECEEMYHYTACREMKVVHNTGVLSYNSPLPSTPVAQFIGPKPFSEKFTKFSFVILNRGEKGTISIGICPSTYSTDNQPGWKNHSIGYHGDDGGIFLENGFFCKSKGAPCEAGDTMECEFLVKEKKVIFYKNGQLVYQTKLKFESSNCFPIVGMHSKGESVKLLQTDPWVPLRLLEAQISLTDKRYTMSTCNEMKINQETGILTYDTSEPKPPVGQFIGPRPFSETFTKFSIVILNRGKKGRIAIGICPSMYQEKRQPGWNSLSLGYHADDGGIYSQYGKDYLTKGIPCTVGDTMECELTVKDKMLTFNRNRQVVFRTKIKFPHTTCFPIIGMHSTGESVKLLEQEPWRPLRSDPIPRNPVGFMYSPSRCDTLQISHQTGILCYAPTAEEFRDDKQGQFIGPKPFSKDFTKFRIEILNAGEVGGIGIGVCCKDYDIGSLPGWKKNSIGYHADDGGIFWEDGQPKTNIAPCKEGDVMQCKFNNGKLTFTRNGIKVYKTSVDLPPGGFYPIVGLGSRGECIRLLESDPWISDDDEETPSLNHFESYTKDNILISPKDELPLTLYEKDKYTSWIVIQNTGLRNILYKVLNENMLEPRSSKASVLKPGTSIAVDVLFDAETVPETLSMQWLTVECMDMNSYPRSIDGVLTENENDTEHYQWRVTTEEEKPMTLSEVSDECVQIQWSENFASPPQDYTDGSQMSAETSVKAQVASVTEQWNECSVCESKDNIVSKCIECSDILCQSCENMHKKRSKTKFHTLLSFDERRNENAYKKLLFCAVHDYEDFIRYCTTCTKLVCTDCMQADHLGHAFSKIDEIARGKRHQLTTVNRKMSDYCSSMSDEGLKEFEGLVKQRADHFIALIRAKEKEILSAHANKKVNMQPVFEDCNASLQNTEVVLKSYSDVRLLADDTLGDLITKLGDFELPKKAVKEDIDDMFLKDLL